MVRLIFMVILISGHDNNKAASICTFGQVHGLSWYVFDVSRFSLLFIPSSHS